LYHSTLGSRVIEKKKKNDPNNGTYPVWLQDAGEFEVHPNPETRNPKPET